MAHYRACKKMQGLTIVKLMLLLFVAGIAGTLLLNYIIDKRCEAEPSREMCVKRR